MFARGVRRASCSLSHSGACKTLAGLRLHQRACFHGMKETRYGTTILCVRKNGKVVMIGDGQVTQGSMVVKGNVTKVRRVHQSIIVGYAGATADCFTLMERLEQYLEENSFQLTRACVEMAKAWRTDKFLRRLEATLIVADPTLSLELTGNGDVMEADTNVISIGSGGAYALAAARALSDIPELSAEDVARRAMAVASDMCVYTNGNLTIESVDDNSLDPEPLTDTDADADAADEEGTSK
ncbi:unnamed protein product [Chrysoparadoxa australica]